MWITPDPVEEVGATLKKFRDDAESFRILECRCVAGFSNQSLVKGAWRLADLENAYATYLAFAADAMRKLRSEQLHPRDLFALIREERTQWSAAIHFDPFLPVALWPTGYMAPKALRKRQELLQSFAKQVPAV